MNRVAFPRRWSHSGMTLVEMVVSMGIFLIILMAFLNTLNSQMQTIRGLSQKSEMLDLKTMMSQQLAKSSVCSWQLAGRKFNTASVTATGDANLNIFPLQELRMGPDATSAILVQVGQRLPGSTSGLVVSEILFKDFIATGNKDEYVGTFEVRFDPQTLAGPFKPVRQEKLFHVADIGGGVSEIKSCGGAGSGQPPLTGKFCDTYKSCPNGLCHIPKSEDSIGCFLTSVDDDTGRIGFQGEGGIPIGGPFTRVDVQHDAAAQPKCEVKPDATGGWSYRASMDCEVVACGYACVFN